MLKIRYTFTSHTDVALDMSKFPEGTTPEEAVRAEVSKANIVAMLEHIMSGGLIAGAPLTRVSGEVVAA